MHPTQILLLTLKTSTMLSRWQPPRTLKIRLQWHQISTANLHFQKIKVLTVSFTPQSAHYFKYIPTSTWLWKKDMSHYWTVGSKCGFRQWSQWCWGVIWNRWCSTQLDEVRRSWRVYAIVINSSKLSTVRLSCDVSQIRVVTAILCPLHQRLHCNYKASQSVEPLLCKLYTNILLLQSRSVEVCSLYRRIVYIDESQQAEVECR